MAQETNAHHRAGSLKQKNKSHKHGRHRTKGEINRDNQGRVNVKTFTRKMKAAEKQAVRRNQAKQARSLRREKMLEKKRQRGGQHSPPHFVVVIGLNGGVDCTTVVDLLSSSISQTEGGEITRNEQGIVHASIARFRQRVSFYIPPAESVRGIMDAAKVADTLLFVSSPDEFIDDHGNYCLKCLMGQGMPSSMFVCHGLKDVPQKKLADVKKTLSRELERRMPSSDSKIHPLDTEQEALMMVRKLVEGKTKSVYFRDIRPHVIAESLSFEAESMAASDGTLKVSGYLRGADLSADRLVHVVGWGTYQIAQIDAARDPHPLVLRKDKPGQPCSMEEGEESQVLARPDPRLQATLDSELEVDPMEDEQTWPTPEELQDAEDERRQRQKQKLKKKGMSEYQAQWMFPEDLKDESGDEDEEEDDEEEGDGEEMEEDSDDDSWKSCSEADDAQSVVMTETDIADDKYDVHFDLEAEKLQLKQLREERENTMFPDEVDTPMDVPARERFAKYRGLESFRTSPWPKDESLPTDYQRIYKVGDMKAFRKRILKTPPTNSVTMGEYVTVHIKGVPRAFMETYQPGSPLVVFGMLPVEQMMSVVHMGVRRDKDCDEVIRSKTRLTFQVGFRRFSACPVFSQLRRGDKHKMERFLPYEEMVVMSVYAPITIGACPVLVFRENSLGEEHMVGSGSLHSVDPDRIILKRTVLSGDMFKMGKKKSVVRFMFFNREDIMWFKSVELRTKLNRRGRILEPIGTHGHMKCHFNGQAKSQDVVLMMLYKRVYPKWTYQPETPALSATSADEGEEGKGEAYALFD